MRLELVKTENGISIVNDAYNASPTSMKAAVELIETMKGYRKKMLVLGDMLELGDEEKHSTKNAVLRSIRRKSTMYLLTAHSAHSSLTEHAGILKKGASAIILTKELLHAIQDSFRRSPSV